MARNSSSRKRSQFVGRGGGNGRPVASRPGLDVASRRSCAVGGSERKCQRRTDIFLPISRASPSAEKDRANIPNRKAFSQGFKGEQTGEYNSSTARETASPQAPPVIGSRPLAGAARPWSRPAVLSSARRRR